MEWLDFPLLLRKEMLSVCVIRMSLFGTSTPLRYGMVWQTRILRLIVSPETHMGWSVWVVHPPVWELPEGK